MLCFWEHQAVLFPKVQTQFCCEFFVTRYHEDPVWAWRLGPRERVMGLSVKAWSLLRFELLLWEPTFKASLMISPAAQGDGPGPFPDFAEVRRSLERPGCFSVVDWCTGNHQGDCLVGSLLIQPLKGARNHWTWKLCSQHLELWAWRETQNKKHKDSFLLQSKGQTGYTHLKVVINTRPTNYNLGGLLCNLPGPRYFNSMLQAS